MKTNYKAFTLKLCDEDRDNIDFVSDLTGINNMSEAIRIALKFYKDNIDQVGKLTSIEKDQKEIKNLLKEIYFSQ